MPSPTSTFRIKHQEGEQTVLQRIKNISVEILVYCVCATITVWPVIALIAAHMPIACICGASMNPTLKDGERYIATVYFQLHHGDIVIADSEVLNKTIVKRIIGIPGDTIAIQDSTIYRNGLPLSESYIAQPMHTQGMASLTLEDGMYFLMGDNRNNSLDSRTIGPVSREEISYVVPTQSQWIVLPLWLICVVFAMTLCDNLANWEASRIMKLLALLQQKVKTKRSLYV